MSWLTGPWPDLAVVAAKAGLMYVTALVCLRVAQRRTSAQWTVNDLYAELRQRGVFDVAQLQYVLYEAKGGLTVVPRQTPPSSPLVSEGLAASVGYRRPPPAPE